MPKDKDLERLTQESLDSDIRTRNYELKVKVVKGVAQVTGIVDTLSEKEQVRQILSGIKGVIGSDIGVSISTDGSIIDVNLAGVGVKSVKGNVYLMGTVDSPEEEKAAIRAASRARGVTSVVSQLKMDNGGYDTDDLGEIFHHQVNNDREIERKDIY